jgi:hypothetical protein
MHAFKCTLTSPPDGDEGSVWISKISIPTQILSVPDGRSCLVLDTKTNDCIGGGFFERNCVTFATPILVTSDQPVELLWEMELDVDDDEDENDEDE